MSHQIVKLITDDTGEKTEDSSWHYLDHQGEGARIFCNGHLIGKGETTADYVAKTRNSGGITCKMCIRRIKQIKSLKL